MKLSIIVPVYNVEKYLEDCVESLLAQRLESFEIILVDDGSKDSSGRICDVYAEKQPETIKVLHIDNGGQGRARNFGIDIARGEYLGFVDSDDWVEADMYPKLCEKADETGADVVVCDFMAEYADGRREYLPAALQEHRLSASGSACNKIFRKSMIGDVRFPGGLWYEDFYFSAMMLIKSARTEFIKEPLYIYRCGQVSTMHNSNTTKNLDMLRILDMLEGYMLPHGYKNELEFFIINHVAIDGINRVAAQKTADREAVIAQMRYYIKEHIPRLSACESYRNETRNRRIISRLNCSGLHMLAQLMLRVKKAI